MKYRVRIVMAAVLLCALLVLLSQAIAVARMSKGFGSRMTALEALIVAAQAQADKLQSSVAKLEEKVQTRMDQIVEELITRTPHWEDACHCDFLIKNTGSGK